MSKSIKNIQNDTLLNSDLKILYSQCDLAKQVDVQKLKQLLVINKNDIAETIFNIEDNNIDRKIAEFDKEIDWEKLLIESNYDTKIIRKIFDARDKIIAEHIDKKLLNASGSRT